MEVREVAEKLVNEGLVTREDVERTCAEFRAQLEEEFSASDSYRPNRADWLDGKWSGVGHAEEGARRGTRPGPPRPTRPTAGAGRRRVS